MENLKIDKRVVSGKALVSTPKKWQQELYKFFCPICMMYFTQMNKATCCGNYICEYCFQDLNETVEISKSLDSIMTHPLHVRKDDVHCPFCDRFPLRISMVKASESVRTYVDPNSSQHADHDQNEGDALTASCTTVMDDCADATPSSKIAELHKTDCINSPLKIGDSYQDLRRKLFTFEDEAKQKTQTKQRQQQKTQYPDMKNEDTAIGPAKDNTINPLTPRNVWSAPLLSRKNANQGLHHHHQNGLSDVKLATFTKDTNDTMHSNEGLHHQNSTESHAKHGIRPSSAPLILQRKPFHRKKVIPISSPGIDSSDVSNDAKLLNKAIHTSSKSSPKLTFGQKLYNFFSSIIFSCGCQV